MTRSDTFSAHAPSAGFAPMGETSSDGFSRFGSRLVRAAAGAGARFFRAIISIAESYHRSHQINRSYAELSALDDRTLSDIGLGRCELAAVAVHCVDYPGVDYRKSAS
ncbi:MAG: DUF1127 domain-containing protein [Methyloligellaceae bacterium]